MPCVIIYEIVFRSTTLPITINIMDEDDNFPVCKPLHQNVDVVETRGINTFDLVKTLWHVMNVEEIRSNNGIIIIY